MQAELIDTRLEERDGDTWVTGRCSFCWEHIAVRAPASGEAVVTCPNDHELRVVELRSAGRRREAA